MLETFAALYASFVIYLLSSWFLDDSVAFSMSEIEWYITGGVRLSKGIIYAVLFGVVLFFINKFILNKLRISKKKLSLYISVCFSAVIILASLIGCVQFITTKPYM